MSLVSLINKIPAGNPAERGFWLYKNVPHGILHRLEEDNFRKTVQFVAEHSPFYKRRFKELNIDASTVKAPQDLKDFFTTAEDLRQNPEEFICLKADTAYETTGTTSKRPKRVYFSRNEVEEAGWAGAVGLWGVGVRPTDRVASAFDYSFWVSGPVLSASCKVMGCFHVEAGRIPPADFYERLKDYKITVIVGDPSWILGLSEVAEKHGAWPVKLLIGGGENMAESTRRYIEKIWKAQFLLSYGQTEGFGALGMENLAQDGYQLNQFHNFFEILNPDPQGYGELVYTNLNRRVMPLVRYRSGDVTRFLNTPSKSGLPGRRIEKLKGRMNEWVPTAIGNIAPWMFEPVFSGVAGLGPDWQIVLKQQDRKDLIEFHAEHSDAVGDPGQISEAFFKSLKKELPDAWNIYQMKFCKIDFIPHARGALRTQRKLARLVDERDFTK